MRTVFLLLLVPLISFSADHTSHKAGVYTISQALDEAKRKLYLGGTSAKNIIIYSLNDDGIPTGEPVIQEIETNCLSLALFANRLYVGNNQDAYLYIYSLSEDGLIVGTPTKAHIATEGQGAYSIAIDPERYKLYVGNMAGINNLCVYSLDEDGLPKGTPSFFTASGYTTSIAIDPIHNKLYLGNYSGQNPFVCELNHDGSLTGSGWSYDSANLTYSMALDIEKRRLYLANNSSENNLTVVRLDENGLPSTYTPYSHGGRSCSLALNKQGNKLYVGKNRAGRNLLVYDLNRDGDVVGTPTVLSLGGPTFSLCIGKRLYLANYQSGNNLYTLEIPSSEPIVSVKGTGTSVKITVSAPNPHWIKISCVADSSIGVDRWRACDGGIIEIDASISDKAPVLWLLESAGFGNYSAVLRKVVIK
jgi:6-phosphogluconolactonase (cycloisomerase 2 family)